MKIRSGFVSNSSSSSFLMLAHKSAKAEDLMKALGVDKAHEMVTDIVDEFWDEHTDKEYGHSYVDIYRSYENLIANFPEGIGGMTPEKIRKVFTTDMIAYVSEMDNCMGMNFVEDYLSDHQMLRVGSFMLVFGRDDH